MRGTLNWILMICGLVVAGASLGSCAAVKKCLTEPNPTSVCLAAQQVISCLENSAANSALPFAEDDVVHGATEPEILQQLASYAVVAGACIAAKLDADFHPTPTSQPASSPVKATPPVSYLADYEATHGMIGKDGKPIVAFQVKTKTGAIVLR